MPQRPAPVPLDREEIRRRRDALNDHKRRAARPAQPIRGRGHSAYSALIGHGPLPCLPPALAAGAVVERLGPYAVLQIGSGYSWVDARDGTRAGGFGDAGAALDAVRVRIMTACRMYGVHA